MKKLIPVFLVIIFLLAGCDKMESLVEFFTPEEQRQSSSVAAPSRETEAPAAVTPDDQPVTEPDTGATETIDVQIDPQNWQEYFDLVEYEEWKDEDSVTVSYSKGYRLVLKDEYVQKLIDDEEDDSVNQFSAHVTCSYHSWSVNVDYDKKELSLVEKSKEYAINSSGEYSYNDTFSWQDTISITITKETPYLVIARGSISKNLPASFNFFDEIIEINITDFNGILRIAK